MTCLFVASLYMNLRAHSRIMTVHEGHNGNDWKGPRQFIGQHVSWCQVRPIQSCLSHQPQTAMIDNWFLSQLEISCPKLELQLKSVHNVFASSILIWFPLFKLYTPLAILVKFWLRIFHFL